MGSKCSMEIGQQSQLDPVISSFAPIGEMKIPEKYQQILNRIKTVIEFHDPRKNTGLKWYKSLKYHFYLYGQVNKGKPFGQCLVYSPNQQNVEAPAIVATKIINHAFSERTLIIYADNSYYFGSIFSRAYQLPRASGKGILVNQDFIYEGEFMNGLPNGYGYFKTKALEFTGIFKEGQPAGQGVQRSSAGLFIGKIFADKSRSGTLITPENKKQIVQDGQTTNDTRSYQTGQITRLTHYAYSPHQSF